MHVSTRRPSLLLQSSLSSVTKSNNQSLYCVWTVTRIFFCAQNGQLVQENRATGIIKRTERNASPPSKGDGHGHGSKTSSEGID